MEYKRNEFDFWGMTVSCAPKLPQVEIKKYKVKSKVTDIRYLNELAIMVFEEIIKTIATTKGCDRVSLNMTRLEQNEIDLIEDIINGIGIEATKRGVGYGVTSITESIRHHKEENGDLIITFFVHTMPSDAIYEYAQEHEEINYFDLMCYVGAQMFEKMGAN